MPGKKDTPGSVSKRQRRFFGMVHACQKHGRCPSAEVRKVADDIKYDDALSFARTKEDGLPEKKKPERKPRKHKRTFREYLEERGGRIDEA